MDGSQRSAAWAGVVAALPDLGMAAACLITWVRPTTFADTMVKQVAMIMVLEFIVVHSAGFMGVVAMSEGALRWRLAGILGLALFYSLFAAGFSVAFHSWWPFVSFWILVGNRMLGVILTPKTATRGAGLVAAYWALGVAAYLGAVFATAIPPVPRLGISDQVVAAQHFTGGGLWIDQPWRVVAAGALYFGLVGLGEILLGRRAARIASSLD